MAKRKAKPALPPHRHHPEPDEPADYFGRQVCRDCGKPGEEGDAQHPKDADDLHPWPEVPPEVLAHEARLLGELGGAA